MENKNDTPVSRSYKSLLSCESLLFLPHGHVLVCYTNLSESREEIDVFVSCCAKMGGLMCDKRKRPNQ